MPSRSARTRLPTSTIRPYVIAYGRMWSWIRRSPGELRRPELARAALEAQPDGLALRSAGRAEGDSCRHRVRPVAELRDIHAEAVRRVVLRPGDGLLRLAVDRE